MKVPIYLSGAIRKELETIDGVGYMRTPFISNKVNPDIIWFADTGCYSIKGEKEFNLEKYLHWLTQQNKETCIAATAPDKVGDALETLKRSEPVLPLIRKLGYNAAFVAQDGLEILEIPWNTFDVLFIGGTTEWKLSKHAKKLTYDAKRRGKLVHMGRVNSFKRFLYAMRIGCDSVDGTLLCFGPSVHLPRLINWIKRLKIIETNYNKFIQYNFQD